jgi:hypothetical protein
MYTACEKNINLQLPSSKTLLLVNGEFTNDSAVHSIRLHRSGSTVTGAPQATVSGASIYVTDKVDTFRYAECDTAPGFYHTTVKCRGKGGHSYFLHIDNIDIDDDGIPESYTASGMMPVPVEFDSLLFNRGKNDGGFMCDAAFFKIKYQGPDYIYNELYHNHKSFYSLTEMLGSGNVSRDFDYPLPKVQHPDSSRRYSIGCCWSHSGLVAGDTIMFLFRNYTREQCKFLKEFDNNTTRDDWFMDNFSDQLRIPSDVSTNIEPSDKAAGYFFIYSVSRISKIFEE